MRTLTSGSLKIVPCQSTTHAIIIHMHNRGGIGSKQTVAVSERIWLCTVFPLVVCHSTGKSLVLDDVHLKHEHDLLPWEVPPDVQ